MRALAAALVLALAAPALAEDAPRAVVLRAGEPAPVEGLLLPTTTAITAAQRTAACEARAEALEKAVTQAPTPIAWWVVPLVAVLAAGAGAGLAVAASHR